jgi:beta-lactam-binding protein with PASTA domain
VQYPSPDSPLTPGAEVALTVAGPEPGTATPDVVGLTAAEARHALEAYGFVVEVVLSREANTDDAILHAGRVWSQSPAAGAAPADHITLLVNP